ncbi:MAG: DUF3995 domain-containing protein [Bacteroidia bacterium]
MNPLYPILFNTSVLIALTALYFFWLIGGKTGLKYAFPHYSKNKKKTYRPGRFTLLLFTAALAIMTWFCLAQTGSFNTLLSDETIKWGNRISCIIFVARAIGNFRYFGFTKTFNEGQFAQLDTYLYSPLCILLALSALFSSSTY